MLSDYDKWAQELRDLYAIGRAYNVGVSAAAALDQLEVAVANAASAARAMDSDDPARSLVMDAAGSADPFDIAAARRALQEREDALIEAEELLRETLKS